jgi:hypothetical protein
MRRMTSWARPRGMVNYRRLRGLAAAGLLCAAMAGWGATAAVATSPPASGAGGAVLAAARAVGCAGVNQATSATVTRYVTTEPVNGGKRTYTQRNATKVRALFRDFCAALARSGLPQPGLQCAFRFGNSYQGTFYAGKRGLATFSYTLRGCPRLALTAAGKTRVTFVIGRVAAAAPHLKVHLAAVLGVPVSQI